MITAENARSAIDPEGRYPADGLTTAEQCAMTVLGAMPGAEVERTRDALQISSGGEAGIVLIVTAEAVEFRLPTVEWTMGAYGPASASRLWKRVKWAALTAEKLSVLVDAARKKRQREFQPCRLCGKRYPPERRSEDVCHGCAQAHLQVVY